MHRFTLLVFVLIVNVSAAFAAGNVKLNAPLKFPDGTIQSTATVQGPKGDAGAIGPQGPQGIQGPKGDTGIQGVQGPAGVCASNPPQTMHYMLDNNHSAMPTTASSLGQVISFYSYPSGNIYGYSSNYGIQLSTGTSNGLAVYYFLKYLPSGNIDSTFPPVKIGGGRWTLTTINGKSAILVDTSSVRYAMPDIFFTEGLNADNNNLPDIMVGKVLPGPATLLPQATAFTPFLVSGKAVTVSLPDDVLTFNLASNGSASATNLSGESFTGGTWAINGNGTLTVFDVLIFKIVDTSSSPWKATYIKSTYSPANIELGPIAITFN